MKLPEHNCCYMCKKPLRPVYETRDVRVEHTNVLGQSGFETRSERTGRIIGWGYAARGWFCSLRCGWSYAIDVCEGKKP